MNSVLHKIIQAKKSHQIKCFSTHKGILLLALGKNLDFNTRNKSGETLLHKAVVLKKEAVIEWLLARGTNPNVEDNWGYFPLYEAACQGYKNIISLLLNKNAEIDYQNQEGETALYVAASLGREAVVKLLLERGARIDIQNRWKNTALYEAAWQGHESIVLLLLNNNASINHRNCEGNTPLYAAVSWGAEKIVRLLLAKDADVSITGRWGYTPLHQAVQLGHEAIVSLLLGKEGLINYQDQDGNTLLHVAAYTGQKTIVELLLNRGAKVNIENKVGYTPFHLSVQCFKKEIVEFLLERGVYSYVSQQDIDFLPYWKNIHIDTSKDLSFYTSLLLAGVRIPQNQEIPDSLALRKRAIETTIANWLEPLGLPEELYRVFTPDILRVLPKLLYWIKKVHVIENKQKEVYCKLNHCNIFSKGDQQALEEILLISEIKNESLEEQKQEEKEKVLKKLKDNLIPRELLLHIQAQLIHQVLVSNITKCRPILPTIANYLVAEVIASNEACDRFVKEIFQHNWKTPYEPPRTKLMQSARFK